MLIGVGGSLIAAGIKHPLHVTVQSLRCFSPLLAVSGSAPPAIGKKNKVPERHGGTQTKDRPLWRSLSATLL
jgi:hypothetical protein